MLVGVGCVLLFVVVGFCVNLFVVGDDSDVDFGRSGDVGVFYL